MSNLDVGRPVSIKDANSMIEECIHLRSFFKYQTFSTYGENFRKKLFQFQDNKYNTFFFKKDKIKRLLDDSRAKYIVVITGAHPTHSELTDLPPLTEEEKELFPPGSNTVLITACEEMNNEERRLKVVKMEKPAIEYPPKTSKFGLVPPSPSGGSDSGDDIGGDAVFMNEEELIFDGTIELLDNEQYEEYVKGVIGKKS